MKKIAELYVFNKERYCQRIEVKKFTPGIVVPFMNTMRVKWYSEDEVLPHADPEWRMKELAKYLKRLVFRAFDSPQKEKGQIIQKYILEEIE